VRVDDEQVDRVGSHVEHAQPHGPSVLADRDQADMYA